MLLPAAAVCFDDALFITQRVLNSYLTLPAFQYHTTNHNQIIYHDIMTTAAARKAWNEAMKATAGAAALPAVLAGQPHKRRSHRHKKLSDKGRRRKRKITARPSADDEEYTTAVWVDALEGVDPALALDEDGPADDDDDDDDDAFDELEDLESGGKAKKRRKKTSHKTKTTALPKRFWPRTLASVLTEDHGRPDGVAHVFLQAQATLDEPQQLLPRRKYCPVTGLPGIYTEPVSGLPYATLHALAQIRERPPPWTTLPGAAAFREASLSILQDMETKYKTRSVAEREKCEKTK